MACTCLNETCTQETIEGVVFCSCETVIENVFCPDGCTTVIREDGSAYCSCTDSVEPTIVPPKNPVYFDNEDYFENVSWTISFKPNQGWESYFSFYPDYSPSNNNYFQVGYNWSQDSGTLWNHAMSNSSFGVFNGRLEPFIIEYAVSNENTNKILNSISLNIEAKRYNNKWDSVVDKSVGFNKMTIYNNTNNTGILNLIEQKTLSDARKYPVTNSDGTQDILFTPQNGHHNINYFFNRVVNQDNNIPIWSRDPNNIFKELNQRAVSFRGKRVLERLRGDSFLVRLTNDEQSRFSIILKNSTNDTTVTD